MSTGAEGQARLEDALHKSQAFLSSGQTPEDLDFKRRQQMESNLGSFVAGQTPQSQFGNIARAGQGATPVFNAQPNATMPNNAGTLGSGYSNSVGTSTVNNAMNQSNSWFSGLSSLMSGLGALGKASA